MRLCILLLSLIIVEHHAAAIALNPDKVGLCECFEEKDYNRSLLLDFENDIEYKVSQTKLLDGKVYAGFKVFKGKQFAQEFSEQPELVTSKRLKSGMVTILLGVFAMDERPDYFAKPEFHLQQAFIERIGRKLTVLEKAKNFGVKANKWVKHKLPMVPQINVKLRIKVASYSYGDRKWVGHPDSVIAISEIERLNERIASQLGNLSPVYTIASASEGLNGNLNGTRFFSTIFQLNGTDKQVLVNWQFVSLDLNWMVKKVLHLNPQLLKKTMYRDYSRFVDAVRLVGMRPYGKFY